MSKTQAKKIARKYAEKLRAENYPFSAIYLFGSHVNGRHHKWSDIDVAVVSDRLKRNIDKNRFLLWDMRMDIDLRIEPHGFTVKDFQDDCDPIDPIVHTIKETGIRIV